MLPGLKFLGKTNSPTAFCLTRFQSRSKLGNIQASSNRLICKLMDTCYLENGRHTVQILASWLNPNPTNPNTIYDNRLSAPVSITVTNDIFYPDWESEIGELNISAYFFKTTHTNADWHIDIYDVRTNFVQRLSGHTVDGKIEAFWHMKDANGVMRTNADLDPEFSSVITFEDPKHKWQKAMK